MRFTLLRAFVALALLANLAYAAWALGGLRWLGLVPVTQRDPGRTAQQVRPEAMRVLSPVAAASAVAAAAAASAAVVGPPEPTAIPPAAADAASGPASAAPGASAAAPGAGMGLACLDLGPLDGGAVEPAERALGSVLPAGAWVRETRPAGPQYAVFVGPILSREAARLRREELVKLKIGFEAIELPASRGGERQGGYSIGRHDTEAAANAALEAFRQRGLRNARVVVAREAGAPRTWLRMDRLPVEQAEAVRGLPASALGSATLGECVVGSVMSVGAPR